MQAFGHRRRKAETMNASVPTGECAHGQDQRRAQSTSLYNGHFRAGILIRDIFIQIKLLMFARSSYRRFSGLWPRTSCARGLQLRPAWS